jgi:ATP-dependent Clp endopeptidase proteolytic subunit ClpP
MYARLRKFNQLRNKSENEDDDDEEEDPGTYTKTVGLEVYFSGEVNQDSVLELNTVLRKIQKKILVKSAEFGLDTPPGIKLYIHSEGGCVFSGLSAMDHVSSMKIPVTTIVDGVCCSAATFILLGGHKRAMKPNSFVLIHQLSNTFWGKFEEMKDQMETVTKLMKHVNKMYKTKTQLSENKLKMLMKRDVYLDSEECIRYKIVDEVFT